MFFIASSGSLQAETHPGLSPRGTFKSLPLQLSLTAAAFGGTWDTQGSHWCKGSVCQQELLFWDSGLVSGIHPLLFLGLMAQN